MPLAAVLRDALTRAELDDQALPALRQILPELRAEEPAEDVAEVDALEALVELIAEHAPLALFLDDLHWADSHTIAALSYLGRRCTGISVVVVAAVASEHASPDHAVRSRLDAACTGARAPQGYPRTRHPPSLAPHR